MEFINKSEQDWISFDRDNAARRVTLVSNTSSMINFNFDYVVETEPDTETEVYTFKTGGASGDVVGIITVVYADSTKARLVSVTRS